MKNLTSTSKTLIMALISIIAATLNNGGVPSNKTAWTIFVITIVGTIIGYIAQNVIKPSVSAFGTIDWMDLIKGLLIALSSGISNWLGSVVTDTPVDLNSLFKLMGMVAIGYLAKNLATQNPTQPSV